MPFIKEPTGYEKTALSDLQGSWENLRDAVVKNFGFTNCEQLLFHIDAAMSWESVRNLDQMKQTLVLIQNIVIHSNAPDDMMEWVYIIREDLDEVLLAIEEGEKL